MLSRCRYVEWAMDVVWCCRRIGSDGGADSVGGRSGETRFPGVGVFPAAVDGTAFGTVFLLQVSEYVYLSA